VGREIEREIESSYGGEEREAGQCAALEVGA